MPSVRSVILLAVFILVISLVGACLSLLKTPDSGGMGRDSYGTQGGGYRAIHDVLSELGIPVERRLHPPKPGPPDATIVFLQPDPQLTGVEPTYLRGLLPWVEAGGRLVIATDRLRPDTLFSAKGGPRHPTMLDSLGLPDVGIAAASTRSGEWTESDDDRRDRDDDSLPPSLLEAWAKTDAAPVSVTVERTGTLSAMNPSVERISLPGDVTGRLILEEGQATGMVSYRPEGDGEDLIVLAAEFLRGKGLIVVVAEPALLSNRLLARDDNSLLAAGLLSPRGNPVLLDEFYHGLSVRGNALYLLTIPGYIAIAGGLLLITGLGVWREAIFLGPSLPDETFQRRDIGEYISAMAQFFSKGRRARPFLVKEVRAGVLRELAQEAALPSETQDVERVASILSRTNARRGQRFQETFRDVDDALASRRRWSEPHTLEMLRRLTTCLSKNA